MTDQTEYGLNPSGDILPQTDFSNDYLSEQRSGRLGHRLTVNMFSNSSSQIVPPSPVANDGPPHQRMDVDQAPGDHNIVEPSPPKRREDEVSNMIGVTRMSTNKRVIIHMESEENNPDDGFSWRKYGQKRISGNPNPRSYYKCSHVGCQVKKHVERGANSGKSLVTTYYGTHEHDAPVRRRKCCPRKNRPGSSMSQG